MDIEKEILEYILELSILLVRQAKLEKRMKSCITCTFKKVFNCCSISNTAKLELINKKIEELEIKKDIIKKNRITEL